ncbi:phosphogluconate dehydrogenase (NAD(+)-dependent, decarboxylating) [Companilactobacillus sp.]|uniref:phosphogluconate dehydrogenase (NAD(+)-dependent, decarboxylating) n=1 Tax=Companilactobacillus sp. TaxID=2767905 RepID=UPI0025BBCBF7|nr:decarboxylating 6-phosphogluconate dehydrogenase [Companilactobacillus sp.]MCH4008990.1 decarboxylating 6-phosphogluconate dehydrogenase [Companilactobacillus sp.]MCH4050831.1 decarboxylating 6-phosphogluconate dehydrogenase [Companilactobacillus sp.]MCH4076933.1 decarboxylating 6-phosphogluconate dehydrogenase [Companilactobacillus sp.]MCH4125508.1 decarboxylating 6-phosphogluconate dehydrogenase [Companilactobacillus sp.]MCI1311217.1 decarboxylating 6-phosphogluconate dehydrogenase [Compa
MKLAMIGLGKMGINLTENLIRNDNEVVAFDLNEESKANAGKLGAEVADSLEDAVAKLNKPKIVWVMLPAGKPTNMTIDTLSELLNKDDIVIDGGNTFYEDSLRHNEILTAKGIKFFDAGTSGGMSGANHDGNFMIGGDDAETFKQIEPIFEGIAQKDGYLYTGKAGSGHYLKMVHNGIEYGMMQSIAEGFDVLEHSDFDYDNEAVAKVWSNGSVIRGWLMELAQSAFSKDPDLDAIKGVMHSSGEGKWTLEEALKQQVPTPVIALSLMMRYRSMEDDTFTGKVVAALRNEFGGHDVDKK